MKYKLLDLLICPSCKCSNLQLTVITEDHTSPFTEVVEGLLDCPLCLCAYPIAGGIPRMMPDCIEEHGARLTKLLCGVLSSSAGNGRAISPQAELQHCSPIAGNLPRPVAPGDIQLVLDTLGSCDLKGLLALNVRCGSGRYLKAAVNCGAEIIGVDSDRAVEKAYSATRDVPNMHVVQANLMQLPFTPSVFDAVFSVELLPGVPDFRPALRAFCSLLQPGGRFGIRTARSNGVWGHFRQWLFPGLSRDHCSEKVVECFRDEGLVDIEVNERLWTVSARRGVSHGGAIEGVMPSGPRRAHAARQN